MPHSAHSLTNRDQLRLACADLSREQLEKIHQNLEALIEEVRQQAEQRHLKRKGDRSLRDMRGLMARAGISMEEFQNALGD